MMKMDTGTQSLHIGPLRRKANTGLLRLRLYAILGTCDSLCIMCGFAIGQLARRNPAMNGYDAFNLVLLALPLYLIFAIVGNGYSRDALHSPEYSLKRALLAIFLAAGISMIAVFLLGASKDVSRLNIVLSFSKSTFLLIVVRKLLARSTRNHADALTSTLVIFDDQTTPRIAGRGEHMLDAIAANLGADTSNVDMMQRLGTILADYDRVVVHCGPHTRTDWALILKSANVTGEIVLPGLHDIGAKGVGKFQGEMTLIVAEGPLNLASRIQKRAFDFALTLPVLLLLSPLLLLIALSIKLDSPGPIFFKQKRLGRGNRLFDIYKFRSMRSETLDPTGTISASRDDNRITWIGRIIRRTSLDELPQLFNVLIGDMSLVGPRPHALGSLAGNQLFWDIDRQYWCRHALKPGITGLAQIRGFRGATHHMRDLQNRLEADLEYASGWTLVRDLTILVSTVRVLLHENAY